MPKIDSFTGCKVMTVPEFWAAEGALEGKSAAEVSDEFYNDMAAEEAREVEHMKDPKNALEIIKRMLSPDNGGTAVYDIQFNYGFWAGDIVECLEVLNAEFSGFRTSQASFEAVVLLNDGTTRTVCYEVWSSYDPPDGDESISVTAVGTNPVVYRYDSTCAPLKQYKAEQKTRLPMCECCKAFGGVAVNGNVNSAAYLVPASTDRGATVNRWVMVCVVHVGSWFKASGWIGPKIELTQQEPELSGSRLD